MEKSEVTPGASDMEFARQPTLKTKELTLKMDVDMPGAVLLMEHSQSECLNFVSTC